MAVQPRPLRRSFSRLQRNFLECRTVVPARGELEVLEENRVGDPTKWLALQALHATGEFGRNEVNRRHGLGSLPSECLWTLRSFPGEVKTVPRPELAMFSGQMKKTPYLARYLSDNTNPRQSKFALMNERIHSRLRKEGRLS